MWTRWWCKGAVLLLGLLVCWGNGWASTPPVPERAPAYVVDLANIIDSRLEQHLNTLLRDLEHLTTVQMVVLTVSSLDGQDIESFSLEVAEKWKIGQKGRDNGLLFTVAVRDHRYRFEVGYGLEGALPDSLLGSLGRKILVPYFRRGAYGPGIAAATGEILRRLEHHYQVTLNGVNQLPAPRNNTSSQWPVTLLFLALFIAAILARRSRGRRRRFGGITPVIFPGGDWGDDSSGGFGGFGGFSGGGGGFGGGGASGGW